MAPNPLSHCGYKLYFPWKDLTSDTCLGLNNNHFIQNGFRQNLEFPLKSFTYDKMRMTQCFFTDKRIPLYILNKNIKHKSTCFIALAQQTRQIHNDLCHL